MARTQHLSLYQAVFIYTREVYRLRTELPKLYKYDLGHEVCVSSIKLLKYVVAANASVKKDPYLSRMALEVEVQWALLRLLYELNAVTDGQFKTLSERLTDITKQSLAWQKWAREQDRKTGALLKKSVADGPSNAARSP